MEPEYCPQCIEELIKDNKHLGIHSLWLICPKCGFRKRIESDYCISKELSNFIKRIKKLNLNENQFNTD